MKKTYKSKKDRLEFVDMYIPKCDPYLNKKIELFKSIERQRMLQEKELELLENQGLFLLEDIAYNIADDRNFLENLGNNKMIVEQKKYKINPGWKLEYNGIRIKIYIPDVLPNIYIKTANEAACYFANEWKNNTSFLIRQWEEFSALKYKKVFVWLKFFHPIKFDSDNKFFKPIIDGIVASELIKDDNCYVLKFGCEGIISHKNPHVEVFIFGDENIPEFIKKGIS